MPAPGFRQRQDVVEGEHLGGESLALDDLRLASTW
jgi:hypothetical protein